MTNLRHHELKLQRALHHTRTLQAEAARWLDTRPYKVHHSVDLATAEKLLLAELLEPVPGELAAIAGDALHNLRSALDNLVYELAVAHRGAPLPASVAADSGFPIFADEGPNTAKNVKRQLRGVHPDARVIIRNMQPYNPGHGGQENLRWLLNDLNAKDKHRLPHLGVPSPAKVSFYVAGPEEALTARQDWPLLEVNRQVEIARYSSAPGIYAGPDLRKPPTFFVAFGATAPEAIVGRPVHAVLEAIHKDITERILPPLVPYLP